MENTRIKFDVLFFVITFRRSQFYDTSYSVMVTSFRAIKCILNISLLSPVITGHCLLAVRRTIVVSRTRFHSQTMKWSRCLSGNDRGWCHFQHWLFLFRYERCDKRHFFFSSSFFSRELVSVDARTKDIFQGGKMFSWREEEV